MKNIPAVKSPSTSGRKLGDTQAKSWPDAPSPIVQNGPISPTCRFVKGVLVQNKDGATYEGIVYDRRLILRLLDGREWWIFDFDPISESLQTNETYELVLSPSVVEAWLAPALDPSVESEMVAQPDHWQGVVVDPEWEAPSGAFRIAHEALYKQKWILVATSFGHLILAPEDIEAEVKAGSFIQWIGTRPDLFAVV